MNNRIDKLPIDERGYPIPYFVAEVEGKPDFRIADTEKKRDCILFEKCWVCGEKLGAYKTFLIGPMCAINRTSSEPPMHKDCAQFSVKKCPFLSKPRMKRNEKDLPEDGNIPGVGIMRNPGVALVWTTKEFQPFRVENGVLFHIGDATDIEWYAEGRPATNEEIMESINTGMPLLEKSAIEDKHPEAAMAELTKRKNQVEILISKRGCPYGN